MKKSLVIVCCGCATLMLQSCYCSTVCVGNMTKEEPAERKEYKASSTARYAAEERAEYQSTADLERALEQAKKMMKECAKRLEFLEAAQYRDEIVKLEAALAKKKG